SLVWSAFQFIDVHFDQTARIWREGYSQYARKAFVLHFENRPSENGKGAPAEKLRAQIFWTYDNGSPGPTFSPSFWIDEGCGMIDIPVGWAKKLLIGIKTGLEGGYYWEGYSNPRIKIGDKHAMDGQPVPSHGTMLLKLIDATDEVLYEQKFGWEE